MKQHYTSTILYETGDSFVVQPKSIVFKLLIVFTIIHEISALSILFPESSEQNTTDPVLRLCPKGTWYHNETRSCNPPKKQGPCPPSLIFYPEDTVYGDCECPRVNTLHQTVWVYSEIHDKCFKSYQQAYCKPGHWLVFDNEGQPACLPNKCEDMQRGSSKENESHPVVLFKDKCVRLSESVEEGHCRSPLVIVISGASGKPICSSNTTSFSLGDGGRNFKCRPGTRKDRLGKCRAINSKVTFRPSSKK